MCDIFYNFSLFIFRELRKLNSDRMVEHLQCIW